MWAALRAAPRTNAYRHVITVPVLADHWSVEFLYNLHSYERRNGDVSISVSSDFFIRRHTSVKWLQHHADRRYSMAARRYVYVFRVVSRWSSYHALSKGSSQLVKTFCLPYVSSVRQDWRCHDERSMVGTRHLESVLYCKLVIMCCIGKWSYQHFNFQKLFSPTGVLG